MYIIILQHQQLTVLSTSQSLCIGEGDGLAGVGIIIVGGLYFIKQFLQPLTLWLLSLRLQNINFALKFKIIPNA